MGRSRFQNGLRLSVILGVGAVTIDVVSRLVFGTLGKTWEDPAWFYVVLLYCVLAGIGISSALTFFATRLRQIGQWIAGLLNGMLVGFFYGGYFSNSNPLNATFGAIAGLLLMGLVLRVASDRPWLKLGVATASAIATYGFTFFVAMWAIAAWSTANVLLALGLSGVGISSLWLCGYQLLKLLSDLKTFPGTFFQGADLSDTTFEGVSLKQTDIAPNLQDKKYF